MLPLTSVRTRFIGASASTPPPSFVPVAALLVIAESVIVVAAPVAMTAPPSPAELYPSVIVRPEIATAPAPEMLKMRKSPVFAVPLLSASPEIEITSRPGPLIVSAYGEPSGSSACVRRIVPVSPALKVIVSASLFAFARVIASRSVQSLSQASAGPSPRLLTSNGAAMAEGARKALAPIAAPVATASLRHLSDSRRCSAANFLCCALLIDRCDTALASLSSDSVPAREDTSGAG